MKVTIKGLLTLLCLAISQSIFAQAPSISYGTGTASITPGVTVSITPTNSGGAVPSNQYFQVSTFAGSNSGLSGTAGYVNGTGTAALFNDPRDMAFDASNNLYVADVGNNAIRKITPAGVVTTFAGSPTGAAGSADGTGTSALFNFPQGLIFDNSGNLFVADYNNHAIRMITPAGVVSTYYQGDPSFFNPVGMCFDMWGQLLIILKRTSLESETEIVTVPGNVASNMGFAFGAIYSSYADIKPGASGNLYITDANRNEIVRLNDLGVLSGGMVAGNYNATTFSLTGVGTNATFTQPTGIQVMPDGTLYVADQKNNDIRKIAPDATVSVLAGYVPLNGSGFPTQQPGYVDGAIANAQFNQPAYIRADNNGNLFVSEWGAGGNRIRKISVSGFFLTGPALPGGLIFDPATGTISGTPLKRVTKAQTDTITAINASGTSVATITLGPGTPPQAPNISYAATGLTPGVSVTLTPQNMGGAVPNVAYATVTSFAGSPSDQAGYINGVDTVANFNWPQTMEMDAAGNLYVADAVNNGIRKITPSGYVSTFAGDLGGWAGFVDSTANRAKFNYPDGTAMDTAGNIYVADYKNNAIRKLTPGRKVTTFYSTTSTFGPGGMCFDQSGNLLIAAQDANQVWKITPAGTASVFAGSTQGYANGSLDSAKFYSPSDVKMDAAGNIYVADYRNNVVRKITPSGTVSLLAGDTSAKYSGYANGSNVGFANGKGAAAIFNNPAASLLHPVA